MNNVKRTVFTNQYEHIGNVRHGVQTGPWRVEFDAPLADEAASAGVNQGSVVSLNSSGEYIIGCAAGTAANHPVPCISMKNSVIDPDVVTGYYTGNQKTTTYSAVGGNITAIPCTCGYELETTEYDTSKTYVPNDALKPDTGDNIGKLTLATVSPGATEVYVGFVSKAPANDYFGNTRISFFANFIPAAGN